MDYDNEFYPSQEKAYKALRRKGMYPNNLYDDIVGKSKLLGKTQINSCQKGKNWETWEIGK